MPRVLVQFAHKLLRIAPDVEKTRANSDEQKSQATPGRRCKPPVKPEAYAEANGRPAYQMQADYAGI